MKLQTLIRSTLLASPALYNCDGSEFKDVGTAFEKIRHFLIKRNDFEFPVGIQLEKGPLYLLTMLACMELGITYVPLKADFPASRIKEIQEDAEIELIIDETVMEQVQSSDSTETRIDISARDIDANHPLYIIFTSGSTGRPKGVIVSRGAFNAYADWLDDYLHAISADDRYLQVTEFTFDISLIDVIVYLRKHTPLYFSQFSGNIMKLASEISAYEITTLCTVPNNVNMLLVDMVAARYDYSSLEHIMIGGARFSAGTYQKVLQHFSHKNVFNFYGPTEFTIYSHAKKLSFDASEDAIDSNVSIGKVNSGMRAEIYKDGHFLPAHEEGELWLAGPQLMSGYKNSPALSAEVVAEVDGSIFYKTGDIAFKNNNAEFFIVGRMDDTIKTRGYRINLLDIDSYIARLEYVQDVTTIAIADEIKEHKTICFIILAESGQCTESAVRKDLIKILVDYQIPEKIIFIDTLPTNVSGKVCKKQLAQIYQDSLRKPT